MIKFKQRKNLKPVKDVKQEQKPLKNISFFEILTFLWIIKPYKNEPIIDTKKLLSI